MNIDWTTVIFEVINFALLVGIMLRFVFRPVAATLDARKAEIAARKRETVEREAAAEAARTRFEAELADIEVRADTRMAEALGVARAEADTILDQARTAARTQLDKAEAELEGARKRTLERFRIEVYRLGAEAARRIIRELGAPEVDLAFARRAAHALTDAVGGAGPLGLVEVAHGPDADRDALAKLLRSELGPGAELRLESVSELVGGVRLQAQGRVVEASVGASLDAWYQSLTHEAEGLGSR